MLRRPISSLHTMTRPWHIQKSKNVKGKPKMIGMAFTALSAAFGWSSLADASSAQAAAPSVKDVPSGNRSLLSHQSPKPSQTLLLSFRSSCTFAGTATCAGAAEGSRSGRRMSERSEHTEVEAESATC